MTTADIDLFAPARLTSLEVYRYNRIAHGYGEHMCTRCKAVYPRTLDYFAYESKVGKNGRRYFKSACITCMNTRNAEAKRQRYEQDAEFRQANIDYSKAYYDKLPKSVIRRKSRRAHALKVRRQAASRQQQTGEG